ncbi:MAG: pirin family protein [Pseudobdellovibrionaceae bacterium]
MDHIDPFLFLNHHGPQVYPSQNQGLPFGPHPHRGFETVTFILEGDIAHRDSAGHESIIESGGIQWMTAGRGLVHSETSSETFKQRGGPLEILQLWVNLPARLKMTNPRYIGFQKSEIPMIQQPLCQIQLIAGEFDNQKGAVEPLFPISLMTVNLQTGGEFHPTVPLDENIFFYLVRGSGKIQGHEVRKMQLIEFLNDGEEIQFQAEERSLILFGHAKPHREAIVAHGPFVMNTREEIHQAIQDYQSGKLFD